jgi:hypothetical protein
MGDVGRRFCEEAEIGWIDLSGNGHIRAKGLFVHVEGRPNRFKAAGRPANVFAPKSARIARWLLIHPDQPISQREIAQAVDMDEGFVSRIVSRLEEEELVLRDQSGRLFPRDPKLLLGAWVESYRFSAHAVLKGHVAARSGEELLAKVTAELSAAGVKHAATGLGAAWLYSHFASFRLASVYVDEPLDQSTLERIGFREDPRGANLWLVVPKDVGVFHGAEVREGVKCVHPVQVYLDLAEHPERAQEAAERLREEYLNWKPDAR